MSDEKNNNARDMLLRHVEWLEKRGYLIYPPPPGWAEARYMVDYFLHEYEYPEVYKEAEAVG